MCNTLVLSQMHYSQRLSLARGAETSGASSCYNPSLRAMDGYTFFLGPGVANMYMEHLGIRELKMESWLEIFIVCWPHNISPTEPALTAESSRVSQRPGANHQSRCYQ